MWERAPPLDLFLVNIDKGSMIKLHAGGFRGRRRAQGVD